MTHEPEAPEPGNPAGDRPTARPPRSTGTPRDLPHDPHSTASADNDPVITSPPRSGTDRRRTEASPYVDLTRDEWSALRERTPLPLTADEVERLRGLGDVIDLDEVRDVYLPLSRLLNLYVGATSNLREPSTRSSATRATATAPRRVPPSS